MPDKANLIKPVLKRAAVLEAGHFVFAAGHHAIQKIEMDHLWEHPDSLKVVLEALAAAENLPPADVILGVPRGGQLLADALSDVAWTGLPMASLERVPGGAKQNFRFVSERDRELALGARSLRIYEDVVTTLSSVAGVVKLLEPQRQTIHSLTIWRRGKVRPEFARGVTDHYLVEEPITNYEPQDCPACQRATAIA